MEKEKPTLCFKLVFMALFIKSCFLFSLFIIPFADRTSSLLASGPYGLIFASFIPFYFDIPVTTRFHVFGFHFSDKSFIYLAGLQVKIIVNSFYQIYF